MKTHIYIDESGTLPDPSDKVVIIAAVPTTHTLADIIQWFKTMTTNEYIRKVKSNNWTPFQDKLWQRNYYESILNTKKDTQRTRQYISNQGIVGGTT